MCGITLTGGTWTLTSCPLMRSLVSVGVSAKCLLCNSRPVAGRTGKGGGTKRRSGACSRGGGCAWQVHVGLEEEQGRDCSASCLLRAIVYATDRPRLSLQAGWGCESCTARKISQSIWECSHLAEHSVVLVSRTVGVSSSWSSNTVCGFMSTCWCHMRLPVSRSSSLWPQPMSEHSRLKSELPLGPLKVGLLLNLCSL